MSLFAAVLLASTSTTPAQLAVGEPAVSPAPAKTAREKKICKTDESDPGSHMVKRTCRTQREWDEQGVPAGSRSGTSVSGDNMQGR